MHVAPVLPGFRAAYSRIAIDLALTEDTELASGRGIDLVIRLGGGRIRRQNGRRPQVNFSRSSALRKSILSRACRHTLRAS
jgi:DNA-binding transcriptional LysR family regulator